MYSEAGLVQRIRKMSKQNKEYCNEKCQNHHMRKSANRKVNNKTQMDCGSFEFPSIKF